MKHDKLLIQGRRTDNGLWKIPTNSIINIPPIPIDQESNTNLVANGVINLDSTKGELAQYYGSTLLNPTKSTLVREINRNHFTSWPVMTAKLNRKHLPKRIETAQSQLNQECINIRTTK